ncbi:hypothetical protein ACHAXR_004268 [Thalassiosira sp. AJA248-18]
MSSTHLQIWAGSLLLTQPFIAVDAFISTPSKDVLPSASAKRIMPMSRRSSTHRCLNDDAQFHCIARPCTRNAVICHASPPGTNTPIIYSFKLMPSVDDGLGPLDFGITDSLSVPDDARPTLTETLSNPRDTLAIVLLLFGGCSVAYHNILGNYGSSYEMAQRISIVLGFLNFIAVIAQLQTSFLISSRPRMGLIDDAALTLYAGLYLLFEHHRSVLTG